MSADRSRHRARSRLERDMCAEMEHQGVPHEHRSLRFRVQLASGAGAEYVPDIVARRGPVLFLLEHMAQRADPDRMDLLAHFLGQHSHEIVLVLIAPASQVRDLPSGAYDEVYASTEIEVVVRRIRDQDPEGMIQPFAKPGTSALCERDVRGDR